MFCSIKDLVTESDVEQKMIFPLLTSDEPSGFGYKKGEILTKTKIKSYEIGKGNNSKIHYPDYLISLKGLPTIIVEAKKPGIDLRKAYSEARMYAAEVNSQYEHGFNPCTIIMVSNGNETWIGDYDTDKPELVLSIEDLDDTNKLFSNAVNKCSKSTQSALLGKMLKMKRGDAKYVSPVSKFDGSILKNVELQFNSFGNMLVFENEAVFAPNSENELRNIVENAYISSKRKEQHNEPIYKEIKRFDIPTRDSSISLATDNPIELKETIENKVIKKDDAYSLMLIIGNVGSGKTTFIRHFRYVYLQQEYSDLAEHVDWAIVDMNTALMSKEEIYTWIRNKIFEEIEKNHSDVDFGCKETIESIFHKEIRDFEKGVGAFLEKDSDYYKREKYEIIKKNVGDKDLYLKNIIRYLRESKRIIPVIVLDNCDKRNVDDQLLLFDVAQWIKDNYKCIVILPMRDSTYDTFKNTKPLDTVVRDLVFRIDPPDILKVMQSRLEYLNRSVDGDSTMNFSLSNGSRVSVKKKDLVEYLKYILLVIRDSAQIKNIVYRLTDRNIRNGIQLFIDLCKSGHISDEDFFRAITTHAEVTIPSGKMYEAILRNNKKYYVDDVSHFANLFSSYYDDVLPDPFVRVDIIYNLIKRKSDNNSKNKDLIDVASLIDEMEMIGHDPSRVRKEIETLIKRGLIFNSALSDDAHDEDMIRVSITGTVTYTQLNNVFYLAACAENVFYKDHNVANEIRQRLSGDNWDSVFARVLNARDMVRYLIEYRNNYFNSQGTYIKENEIPAYFDVHELEKYVDQAMDKYDLKNLVQLFDRVKLGERVTAEVIAKDNRFLRVRPTELKIEGVVFISEENQVECLGIGDYAVFEIKQISYKHRNLKLKYINTID